MVGNVGRALRITCVLGPYLPVPAVKGGAVEKIWLELCKEFALSGHKVTIISRRYKDFPIHETLDGVAHIRVSSRDAPASKILYRLFDIVYALKVTRALPPSDITITNSVSLPLLLPRSQAGAIYVSVARFPKGQLWMYQRVQRLQAVSSAVAAAIKEQTPRMASRIKVIPNALSSAFLQAGTSQVAGRSKEILYVGRIAREKGLDILLRAYAQIQSAQTDWTLTLLGPFGIDEGGDGWEFVRELQRLAASSPGRVNFEPAIFDERALRERLQSAAIFVYPSIAERGESFGMAPLEAMACGCSVVVSNLACFRDFIRPDENALVFDHRDTTGAALAETLKSLLDDSNLRTKLGGAAAQTAISYAPRKLAQLYIDDFVELAVEKGSQ